LEGGEVLTPHGVGFGQEGQAIVYPDKLGSLTYLPLVVFLHSLNDGLPHILRESLVRVGCVCVTNLA